MLKDVKGVAQRNTVKEVSDGYALNFLIAQGLAVQATPEKLAQLESRKKAESLESAAQQAQWDAIIGKIQSATIEVAVRANPAGHLYEQLAAQVIAQSLQQAYGVKIPTDAIVLDAPIKSLGEVRVPVKLGNAHAKMTVRVVAASKK